jgi:hypothetical protein
MPVINPIDKILLPINDMFSVATEKVNASRAVKYGDAMYDKAEARAKLIRELASRPGVPERVELINKKGIDDSMDLLGKGGSL